MKLTGKSSWRVYSLSVVAVAATLTASLLLSREPGGTTQSSAQQEPPLLTRGFTDAPSGTVALGADPEGGGVLTEMRVKEGESVKRGDIVAVLSNFPNLDYSVRRLEADLEKQKLQRATMTSGFRVTQIAMQEIVVKNAAESRKLKELELARSGITPEMKQLELNISQDTLEREQTRLKLMKESLANELEQLDLTIQITEASILNAKKSRELALIRSPIDGTVVQIFTRAGERISPHGVAKIVDMNQLRVYADVDEIHLSRISVGSKVEVVVRGASIAYAGKVSRVMPVVKRLQRLDPDGGNSTDSRVVQVEITFDDLSHIPKLLGREVRVTFL